MNNSQELANRIKSVAKEKKIQIGKMLTECELSVNTLSSMKSGGYYPRLEAVAKIADYLGCSVDYLLGREDTNSPVAKSNSAETDLLDLFNRLPDGNKEEAMRYLRYLAANSENE